MLQAFGRNRQKHHTILLSQAYKTRIDVEFCGSVKYVEYVCKYVNGGSGLTAFQVQITRIKMYMD